MQTHTPVITANVSSMPEVAGGAALLVDPYNPQTIAQAMQTVYTQPQKIQELIQNYRDTFANPYVTAQKGFLDDVIEPKLTRKLLIQALNINKQKRKELPKRKHGNIPL
jgi:acetyl-CoA carboxylase carboxyltransferase component